MTRLGFYDWDDLAAVIELTGDGHGHHVAGTPDVYRHGWVPLDGTEAGEDGIRRPGKAVKPEAGPMTGKAAGLPGGGREGTGGKPPAVKRIGPLEGDDLWNSGHGQAEFTPGEIAQSRNVWYSDNYDDTNRYLRDGERPPWSQNDPAEFARYRADLKAFTAKIRASPPLHHSARVYRGVSDAEAIFGPPGSLAGKTFTDKGIASVSPDRKAAAFFTQDNEDGAVVSVDIPAGMRAMRLGPESGNPEDIHEYVLPPGTRYLVTSDTVTPAGRQIRLMVAAQPRKP